MHACIRSSIIISLRACMLPMSSPSIYIKFAAIPPTSIRQLRKRTNHPATPTKAAPSHTKAFNCGRPLNHLLMHVILVRVACGSRITPAPYEKAQASEEICKRAAHPSSKLNQKKCRVACACLCVSMPACMCGMWLQYTIRCSNGSSPCTPLLRCLRSFIGRRCYCKAVWSGLFIASASSGLLNPISITVNNSL